MASAAQVGFAQAGAQKPDALAFEVASVRENVSGPGGGWYEIRPDGLSVTFAGRPIVDATGLAGTFEWRVEFIPGSRSTPDVPSIFAAFEEQLGLRLRPATADVEVLVIESVELPDPN